ncbi:MAG TPA: carbonic anhydrase [Flavitalea sp.]|nr:carbonic anhydrase [Flavitalea sp.]
MKTFEIMLLENKAWAAEQLTDDPGYFGRLAKVQTPEFLWIGCSDSRVPANQITGTLPGEVFVHRNIANLVVENDINFLSVLHYAVNYLKVKNIIVCGHYGCGGVKAALGNDSFGILDKWLLNIKSTRDANWEYLSSLPCEDARADALAELNVKQQVQNIINTTIIQDAWNTDHRPIVHGWIYALQDGLLKPLVKVEPEAAEAAYKIL